MTTIQRRQFLRDVQALAGAGALLSLSGTAPLLLQRAAADADESNNNRVLVVLQLSGGNDGLNTLIPFRHDEYVKARPTLAIPESQVLKLTDELGLHPAMTGLREQFEKSRVAFLQGIGYDNPNRSHFESMDIWHTCRRKDEGRNTGWLGRCCDRWGSLDGDVPGLHLGANKQPLALAAERTPSPSIGSLEKFQLKNTQQEFQQLVRQAAINANPAASNNPDADGRGAEDSLLSFVQSNTNSALEASRRIRAAAERATSGVEYPDTPLGAKLKTIAQLIGAGLKTKVYYVELDGFDTHSEQDAAHTSLLRKWSSATAAFMQDLEQQGAHERVLMMCFSEFGRRVAENASKGTDHGAAGVMTLVGESVRGGVIGELPSLTDLAQGDLKHHTDFRRVYATVLEKWLETSSDVLDSKHKPLDLLASFA